MYIRHAPNSCWFALIVRPNHERTAAMSLHNRGLEAYVPSQRVQRQWSDRKKTFDAALFPGYVFCRFLYEERLGALSAAGVRSVAGAVDEAEIAAVRALISSGRPITPWPYVRIGEIVEICSGPFANLRGKVIRVKESWRVVVSVDALGCSVSVELDAERVAPERKPWPLSSPGIESSSFESLRRSTATWRPPAR
jgi:transcription antitermination factor NusG